MAIIMKICSTCGRQTGDNGNFCQECGGKLIMMEADAGIPCPNCGRIVKAGMEFCGECGFDFNGVKPGRQQQQQQQQSANSKQIKTIEKTAGSEPPVKAAAPEKKRNTGLIVCIIVLAAILSISIVVIMIMWLSYGGGDDSNKLDVERKSKKVEVVQEEKAYHWDGDYLKDEDGNTILHIEDLDDRAGTYVDGDGNLRDADGMLLMNAAQYERYLETHKKESTYVFTKSDADWFDAKTAARAEGGYLVSINDAEEFRKVCEIADSQGVSVFWVGASRTPGRSWDYATWEDGSDLDYTEWFPGEPSEISEEGEEELYLMIFKVDGKWYFNDAESDVSQYYAGKMGYMTEIEG